ncbi:MAG: DUF2911 domain-containing protein [Myxococcota bacterium]
MGATWVILAVMAGCNAQNKVEPAGVATEAAVEPVAEAPVDEGTAIPTRGDDAERASKNGELSHAFGDATVVVRYGKPTVKGRTIFGDLVPYGRVWRTGANEASVFATDADLTVEGQPLPKGVYGLFTVPGEEEWTVIFNGNAEQWGAGEYDAAKDALRVAVKPEAAEASEAFDVQATETGIVMRWAEVAVPVSIAAAAADAAPEGEAAPADAEERTD